MSRLTPQERKEAIRDMNVALILFVFMAVMILIVAPYMSKEPPKRIELKAIPEAINQQSNKWKTERLF